MDAKKLGQFIAKIRKEKNLTQAELASKFHVTDKSVSKWEQVWDYQTSTALSRFAAMTFIGCVNILLRVPVISL